MSGPRIAPFEIHVFKIALCRTRTINSPLVLTHFVDRRSSYHSVRQLLHDTSHPSNTKGPYSFSLTFVWRNWPLILFAGTHRFWCESTAHRKNSHAGFKKKCSSRWHIILYRYIITLYSKKTRDLQKIRMRKPDSERKTRLPYTRLSRERKKPHLPSLPEIGCSRFGG